MLVAMTDRELYRPVIIRRVFERALIQIDAEDIQEHSVRQVHRLIRKYLTDGASPSNSGGRGLRYLSPFINGAHYFQPQEGGIPIVRGV